MKNIQVGISSPNPKFPSEIEVIDGYNIFDGEFTTNGVWKDDGTINYVIQSKLYWRTDFIKIPNKNIFFSSKQLNIFSSAILLEFDTDKKYIKSNKIYQLNSNLNNVSLNESTRFIAIQWNLQNATEIESSFTEFRITEGMSSKPYLPHGTIGLEQSGKNKVDFINYVEKVFDSSKVEKLDDGSYKFKHADASYPLYEGLLKPPYTLSFWAKNDTGETIASYTFSFKIFYEDGTYDRVSMITNGNFARKEFKINKNVIKIANTYTSTKPFTIIKDVQLEEGSTATSYEPHHETKLIPIDLQGNTLARVGDIKDKLIIHRNGEVELMKNIWKKNISITSIIEDSGTKMAVVGASGKKRNNRTLNTGLCTKAIMTKGNPLYNGTFYENATNFVFVGANEDTLETMKSKYDNAELYYQLETPQIIKLPSINPIDLWQGTNIFKLITNLETNFEVEYVVDKDSMLDEVQTAMLNAEIEI